MPIGKNAIKRVKNNGYSNVKTSAPDMENSSVITKPDAQVVEKMIAPVEKATAKKAAAKKAPAKKPAEKKTVVEKKPVEKKTVVEKKPVEKKAAPAVKKAPAKKAPAKKTVKASEKKKGFERVSFGEDMPYYLL